MSLSVINYNKVTTSRSSKYADDKNIGQYGGFNLAAGTKLFNDYYNLFTCRFSLPAGNTNKIIIPGNSTKCTNNIPPEYYGQHFAWNNWSNLINRTGEFIQFDNILFIGEINQYGSNIRLIEKHELYIPEELNFSLDDVRILHLSENDKFVNYLLCPRSFKSDFLLVSIIKTPSFDKIFPYVFNLIKVPNYEKCIRDSDINVVCYDFDINTFDTKSNKVILKCFRWFEDNCITQINYPIIIPDNDYINNMFKTQEKFSLFHNYSNLKCELVSNCNFQIQNDFVKGINKVNGPSFSFGSPFINIGNNKLLAVGHAKIATKNTKNITYNTYITKIRDNVSEIMNKMFSPYYKEHYGSSFDCTLGYMYFSYFILYNMNNKTFNISDFFIPYDIFDLFHFSLIFTIGIFEYNTFDEPDSIIITSGEGDYYNSIMQFEKEQIINDCKYDILSSNFNIETVKFLLINIQGRQQIDCLTVNIDNIRRPNIIINETDTTKLHALRNNATQHGGKNINKQKYLKYKMKYLKLKTKV